MKKQLQDIIPRSARDAATSPPGTTGAVMSLDDLPENERSQVLEESLERAVLPQHQREEEPHSIGSTEHAPAALPAAILAQPRTKMIATPIDAQLRQSVRDLRGQFEISESFVVETALRIFFADRPLSDVAADLRARGGRLRRTR